MDLRKSVKLLIKEDKKETLKAGNYPYNVLEFGSRQFLEYYTFIPDWNAVYIQIYASLFFLSHITCELNTSTSAYNKAQSVASALYNAQTLLNGNISRLEQFSKHKQNNLS